MSESTKTERMDRFATTHWSVVLSAANGSCEGADQDLEKLCRAYWYPLYAHVRRRGHDHHAAQDVTQGFFARILEKRWLSSVSPTKGRFRSFLLAALDHYIINEWRSSQAEKRGGGRVIVPLEQVDAGQDRYAHSLASDEGAESVFDRDWAAAVLEQALGSLATEFTDRGRSDRFQDWKVFLTREASVADCEASALRLGISPAAVTVGVHRLRARYGVLLRQTVDQTLSDPADADEELHYLFGILNA